MMWGPWDVKGCPWPFRIPRKPEWDCLDRLSVFADDRMQVLWNVVAEEDRESFVVSDG